MLTLLTLIGCVIQARESAHMYTNVFLCDVLATVATFARNRFQNGQTIRIIGIATAMTIISNGNPMRQ